MKTYILGHYFHTQRELRILSKPVSQKIIKELRDSYPSGLTPNELAERTGEPISTIHSHKNELERENFIVELSKKQTKRGRPSSQQKTQSDRSSKYVIEDVNHLFRRKLPFALAPGNVVYPREFADVCDKVVPQNEKDSICGSLLNFVQKVFRIVIESNQDEINNWAPAKNISHCCPHCGVNHEARDFIRAVLLNLIDDLENNDKFIEFMKRNELLTSESYDELKIYLDLKNETGKNVKDN